jgi:hypothetical protein
VENGVTLHFENGRTRVVARLGRRMRVVTSKDTMRRRAWRCCDCCEVTKSEQPIP